jgi:ATP-dependent Clp protease ATP-binding subunit ClpC
MAASPKKIQTWFAWAKTFLAGRYVLSTWRKCLSASSIIVLTESAETARSLGCDAIGVEHLLAGFLKIPEGRVFPLLNSANISLEALRSEIERRWGPRLRNVDFLSLPFTPRCRRVVERAWERARHERVRLVEPEDLFLELIEEQEGLVAELFQRTGVKVASLREDIIRG